MTQVELFAEQGTEAPEWRPGERPRTISVAEAESADGVVYGAALAGSDLF